MAKHDNSKLILLIDTTIRDQTNIALIGPSYLARSSRAVRAQELQKMIDQLLQVEKKSLIKIGYLAVLAGPGSYTGSRIGVTAVNTLAWLLEKPIIQLEEMNFEQAIEMLQLRKKWPTTKLATVKH